VVAYVIATETFKPLILAQAKARKVEPRILVVKHPVGGLNAQELEDRIETAWANLKDLVR
jgi:hypothetical protein